MQQILFADISGYITSVYGDIWWLSYFLDKDEDCSKVQVIFLHPPGPSHSFIYPIPPDTLWITFTDMIWKVNTITQTGRTYSLSDSEVNKYVSIFQQLKSRWTNLLTLNITHNIGFLLVRVYMTFFHFKKCKSNSHWLFHSINYSRFSKILILIFFTKPAFLKLCTSWFHWDPMINFGYIY